MTDPVLTVTKLSYWQPVATNADGVPLSHGEPMVEIEPGVWADPVYAAAMQFLASALNED